MRNTTRLMALALLGLIPIGCGGGGDGIVPQVGQVVTITEQNDVHIGSSIYGVGEFFGLLGEVLFEIAMIVEDGGTSGTFACDDGTFTVSWTDAEPVGELSPGDTATITFNDCVQDLDGEPLTLNGSVTFTVGLPASPQLAQLPPVFRIRILYALDAFELRFPGGDTIVLSGEFTHDYTRELDDQGTQVFVMITQKITGDYVEGTLREDGERYDVWLADFSFERLDNTTTGNYLIGFRGDMYDGSIPNDDGTFGGQFFFETGTVLAGITPFYPTSGNWYVNGTDDTSATYTARPSGASVLVQTFKADGTRVDTIVACTDLAD